MDELLSATALGVGSKPESIHVRQGETIIDKRTRRKGSRTPKNKNNSKEVPVIAVGDVWHLFTLFLVRYITYLLLLHEGCR